MSAIMTHSIPPMMRFAFIAVCVFSRLRTIAGGDGTRLLCTEQFCSAYRESVGCPRPDAACSSSGNRTRTGTRFPSPTPCNCCELCVEHIEAGEYCSIGEPGAPTPNAICGAGLKCKRSGREEHPRCVPIDDTDCTRQRSAYDRTHNGSQSAVNYGMERPVCTADGLYAPIRCIPGQVCFCVDEQSGERIFGLAEDSPSNRITMKCECARLNAKFQQDQQRRRLSGASQLGSSTARCLDDGSYDPLQCVGDRCVCVSRYFGQPSDGGELHMNTLEDGYSQLPCFDTEIHSARRFLHTCEANQFEQLQRIEQFERDGITVLHVPPNNCAPDGWFAGIQHLGDWSYCAHKNGQQIGNYRATKSSTGGQRINCNCAHAELLVSDDNMPKCCANGNYPSMVCQSDKCYCLNADGEQTTIPVVRARLIDLPCFSAGIDVDEVDRFCGADDEVL